MSGDRDTVLLRRACRMRWPGRHVAGLAQLTRRSKATAASWLSGRRGMPVKTMDVLARVLCDDGSCLIDIGNDVARVATLKRAQPRRARGFQVVKDWDGTGIASDRRWRRGRSRKR
jgi:hypothetical protein